MEYWVLTDLQNLYLLVNEELLYSLSVSFVQTRVVQPDTERQSQLEVSVVYTRYQTLYLLNAHRKQPVR